MTDNAETDLVRRKALKKLSKLSAYSAPAVASLLLPVQSFAAASIPAGTTGCIRSSRFAGAHAQPGANHDGNVDSGFRRARNRFNSIVNGANNASDCGE